jgi:hypothetical protein
VFQIDGNLGAVAGICEMLIQSHDGAVSLLPALPQAWSSGLFYGLRARGGVTVGASWNRGRLTTATLIGSPGNTVVLETSDDIQWNRHSDAARETHHDPRTRRRRWEVTLSDEGTRSFTL